MLLLLMQLVLLADEDVRLRLTHPRIRGRAHQLLLLKRRWQHLTRLLHAGVDMRLAPTLRAT